MKLTIPALVLTLLATLVASAQAVQPRVYNSANGPKPCDRLYSNGAVSGIGTPVYDFRIEWDEALSCAGVAGVTRECVTTQLRYAGRVGSEFPWRTLSAGYHAVCQDAAADHLGFSLQDVWTYSWDDHGAGYTGCDAFTPCNLYDAVTDFAVTKEGGKVHVVEVITPTIGTPYEPVGL